MEFSFYGELWGFILAFCVEILELRIDMQYLMSNMAVDAGQFSSQMKKRRSDKDEFLPKNGENTTNRARERKFSEQEQQRNCR